MEFSVQRDEQVGGELPGAPDPAVERDEHVAGTRHIDIVAAALREAILEPLRHGQHDRLLGETVGAHGARVDAAVPRIDEDHRLCPVFRLLGVLLVNLRL